MESIGKLYSAAKNTTKRSYPALFCNKLIPLIFFGIGVTLFIHTIYGLPVECQPIQVSEIFCYKIFNLYVQNAVISLIF